MGFSLRKAQPEDGPFLAEMIMMAGRNHISRAILEYLLGGKPNDCMTFLQMLLITQTPHLFHHSCYMIAENSSGPVAVMGGYDPNTMGYQAFHAAIPEVSPILGWSATEQNLVKERTDKLVPCMPRINEGAWIIDRGATKPDVRRQGAAAFLLEGVVAEGKELGFGLAQTNIYIGNEPGIKLFEKNGFTVAEEKVDEFFERMIGAPGMVSLQKQI
ncbi:MAG: GNAT family N-acetyltransferase [Desulfurivibrionaceae bacterium]|nr:GNAT family N-acetyltransferase [Desulfobulbales bacterium]MDT8334283.1 GNAT family N-acetyltransferase [Desulfurivibrionaceae bacterium]